MNIPPRFGQTIQSTLPLIILAGILLAVSACQKLASDDILRSNYSNHKSEFDRSVQLFRTLNVQSVDSIAQPGDSEELMQLRSLLRTINVRLIRQYPEEIKLVYQGEGSVLNSTEKGYSWRAAPPSAADMVTGIDSISRPYKDFGDYYAPLDKPWYIFLFNDA